MHTLSAHEAREKLHKLDEYLPCDQEGVLVAFGRVLADRLHDGLTPAGFVRIFVQVMEDLHTGTNRETGQLIHSPLVGESNTYQLNQLFKEEIQNISDVIFPPDFAAGIRIVLERGSII